ncbi:hypothetical protein [Streptomyces sp. NPDC058086]
MSRVTGSFRRHCRRAPSAVADYGPIVTQLVFSGPDGQDALDD